MSQNNTKYTNHLLKSLFEKRQLAIRELSSTGLNVTNGYSQINQWFEQIQKWVEKHPPTFYVKSIEIFEDENEKVLRITYTYFKEDDEIIDSTFIIHSHLY